MPSRCRHAQRLQDAGESPRELDKDTGKINAFAVRTVVENPEQVEDPLLQITLEDDLLGQLCGDPSKNAFGLLGNPQLAANL